MNSSGRTLLSAVFDFSLYPVKSGRKKRADICFDIRPQFFCNYCADAIVVVPTLAICFSATFDGTANFSATPNSGNCIART